MAGLVESIVEVAKMGNRYIDVQAPWHLLKTDKARMNTVLYVLFELIRLGPPIQIDTCIHKYIYTRIHTNTHTCIYTYNAYSEPILNCK